MHWQEIALILTIYEESVSSGQISRYGDSSQIKSISEYVLDKFNKLSSNIKLDTQESDGIYQSGTFTTTTHPYTKKTFVIEKIIEKKEII